MSNFILKTDSYKLTHHKMYPEGTTGVYSYFEARNGAQFDETVFFGLQPILRELNGKVVTKEDVVYAAGLASAHFGNPDVFNAAGWMHIVNEHEGKLPIRIKAVPEGSVVPVGNVMMTVENTCPDCYWLTNALESMLTHVWYPMTVATKSREVKKLISRYLAPEEIDALPFMLHDFGYRGATGDEAAARGGAAHLISFVGTDTLVGMELALSEYLAAPESLAFSVPATEHSVMTALGRDGEFKVVQKLFKDYPTGILSIVIDSYDTYNFVSTLTTRFKDEIRLRDGKVVFRPDSKTQQHPRPGDQVKWILRHLDAAYGTTLNSEGRRVLDPHVGVLWGDGIDIDGIEEILEIVTQAGYSAANLVFGMGGGLLQKVNRDTQRCAFKSSAQRRNGEWHDVSKDPLDATKKSKAGRLKLCIDSGNNYGTVREDANNDPDQLDIVFENGEITRAYTFAEVRQNAE